MYFKIDAEPIVSAVWVSDFDDPTFLRVLEAFTYHCTPFWHIFKDIFL